MRKSGSSRDRSKKKMHCEVDHISTVAEAGYV
jgi:hypothetical protein